MAFTIKSYEEILANMITWIVANSSKITDITPGSVIRSFCEGAALSIEEVYVAVYLGYRRYLNNVQSTIFDFERKSGTKASTEVVFSRTGTSGDVTIPTGTRLKTPSGLRFLTTEEGTISDGSSDSGSVEVQAEETGTSYNVSGDSITVLEDTISGVDTVTNALAATGGVNQESDISYKKRFQDYIEGLGRSNIAGLSAGALGVEGITSVSVVELFPPVGNVNVDLYIDDGSPGGVSPDKLNEVQSVIDGDGTEENPGYRAAGVNVVVKGPGIVTQDIDVTVTILAGVDTDQLQSDVGDNLTEYVNNLGVGGDIVYNELIAAVMEVFGVEDCDVTDPSANVTIADTQVGRVGTITLTVS